MGAAARPPNSPFDFTSELRGGHPTTHRLDLPAVLESLRLSACPLACPSCPSLGQRLAPPLEHFRISNLAWRPAHRRRCDRSPAPRRCPTTNGAAESALNGPQGALSSPRGSADSLPAELVDLALKLAVLL